MTRRCRFDARCHAPLRLAYYASIYMLRSDADIARKMMRRHAVCYAPSIYERMRGEYAPPLFYAMRLSCYAQKGRLERSVQQSVKRGVAKGEMIFCATHVSSSFYDVAFCRLPFFTSPAAQMLSFSLQSVIMPPLLRICVSACARSAQARARGMR